MARQVHEPRDAWGDFVYAKVNALDALRRDLDRLERKGDSPSVLLSSVTDPYQAAEGKLKITKTLLSEFVRRKYCGRLSILTKSPLVLRDASLIQMLPNVEVGVTVNVNGDPIVQRMEAHAPPTRRRLDILRRLSEFGIATYAFVGPLFPHVVDHLGMIDDLFARLRDVGVRCIFVEHLNAPKALRLCISTASIDSDAALLRHYVDRPSQTTIATIASFVESTARKHDLTIRTGNVIQHGSGNASGGHALP